MIPHKAKIIISIGGVLMLAGCGKKAPEYTEVREIAAAEAAEPEAVAAAAHVHAEAMAGEIKIVLPEGWVQVETGRMQRMTLQAGTPPNAVADVSLSAFPGDVGGVLANVNRWRRQVGLGPVAEGALEGIVKEQAMAQGMGWRVDFTGSGAEPLRVVVTALGHGGETWFIKMTGAPAVVEGEIAAYNALLASLRLPQ